MLVKKIDIHVHTTRRKGMPRPDGTDYATPEELRKMYDAMGIEFGVLLPSLHLEGTFHTNTNDDIQDIAEKYPESFVWFCNIDPRMGWNTPDADLSYFMEYYKSQGAKGVGEICCNLAFDDPYVENLFYHAEKCGLPLTFHIGQKGNDYGLIDEAGLPGLERALQKFPKLTFLGHSQKFWAEISGEVGNRNGYPTGKVAPGGRIVELMRKYPNLCGDLSAGSGQNALMRDPEFAYKFLEEFQDRLFFGTDICSPTNRFRLSAFLDEAVENGHISQECYNKVSRENALRLLGMLRKQPDLNGKPYVLYQHRKGSVTDMTLEQMQRELGLNKLPACFEACYQQIKDSWQTHGQQLLSAEFILQTLESCYALAPYRALVMGAAEQVRQKPALVLLVCLLERWIRDGGNAADPDYEAPIGTGIAYDFLHLFPAIPTMPESVAHLRDRGVPEDVIAATLGEYDFCVDMCNARQGRPAFDRGRLSWISRVIRNQLIRIGRFKYDLPGHYIKGYRVYRSRTGEIRILADGLDVHRSGRLQSCVGFEDPEGGFRAELQQTDKTVTGHPISGREVARETVTLDKTQWEQCLCPEDLVPRIHIPSDGSFDTETVEASYARAREIFDRCYPDYPYKAFFCHSWLMSPDLWEVMKPGSNILAFQNKFIQVPCGSTGKLVFSFVFQMDAAIPENLAALPEKTSLQRAIKELYLNGGYIHEGEGFFF